MRRFRIIARLALAALVAALWTFSLPSWVAYAQDAQRASPAPKAKAGAAATPSTATSQPTLVVPSDDALLRMISSTLIALNQANATGNYSVFRELGAPGFQVANSTGRLAEIFASLRRGNFDLSAVVLLQPKLLRKPEINDRGMLRLSGFFPTQPERINFDLMYQFVEGQWRLFGIAADTTHVSTAAPAILEPQKGTARVSEPPPVTAALPGKRSAAAALDSPAESQTPPDVRERVEELEFAASAPPAADHEAADTTSSYNPLRWFR